MKNITLDITKAAPFLKAGAVEALKPQDIALENGVLARGRKQSESAGHIATVEYVDPVSIIPSESGRTGRQRESKRLFYKVSGQFFLIVWSAGRKGKKNRCSNDCAGLQQSG